MKRYHYIFAWSVLISCGLFIATWVGYAEFIRKEAEGLILETQQQGWNISGTAIKVTGFPGPHIVTWAGQMWQNNLIVKIPSATLSGWPVPKSFFTLETPQGFTVLESGIQTLKADLLRLKIEVPTIVPLTINNAGMQIWQQRGGRINIAELTFAADALSTTGTGFFEVDASLQPVGRIDFRFEEPEKLLETIHARTGDTMAYSLAKTFITSAQKIDETTGLSYVPLPLQIINQTVYVGPLRVTKLQTVNWEPQGNPQ